MKTVVMLLALVIFSFQTLAGQSWFAGEWITRDMYGQTIIEYPPTVFIRCEVRDKESLSYLPNCLIEITGEYNALEDDAGLWDEESRARAGNRKFRLVAKTNGVGVAVLALKWDDPAFAPLDDLQKANKITISREGYIGKTIDFKPVGTKYTNGGSAIGLWPYKNVDWWYDWPEIREKGLYLDSGKLVQLSVPEVDGVSRDIEPFVKIASQGYDNEWPRNLKSSNRMNETMGLFLILEMNFDLEKSGIDILVRKEDDLSIVENGININVDEIYDETVVSAIKVVTPDNYQNVSTHTQMDFSEFAGEWTTRDRNGLRPNWYPPTVFIRTEIRDSESLTYLTNCIVEVSGEYDVVDDEMGVPDDELRAMGGKRKFRLVAKTNEFGVAVFALKWNDPEFPPLDDLQKVSKIIIAKEGYTGKQIDFMPVEKRWDQTDKNPQFWPYNSSWWYDWPSIRENGMFLESGILVELAVPTFNGASRDVTPFVKVARQEYDNQWPGERLRHFTENTESGMFLVLELSIDLERQPVYIKREPLLSYANDTTFINKNQHDPIEVSENKNLTVSHVNENEIGQTHQTPTQDAILFEDNFESYDVKRFPPSWKGLANATDRNTNYVDNSPSQQRSKSLKLYGRVGGCWGALAFHPIQFNGSIKIALSVYNGHEVLSGCHPDRANICLREKAGVNYYCRELVLFKGDGRLLTGTGKTLLNNYNTNTWYNMVFQFTRNEGVLDISYWIDGDFILKETIPKKAGDELLSQLELTVQEGSAWFSNVRVVQVSDNQPTDESDREIKKESKTQSSTQDNTSGKPVQGILTDERDQNTYPTVKIGLQTWMARNLNFATPKGSWCYVNQSSYCETYGRLYDFPAAKTACPDGWHLPTDEEWKLLEIHLGLSRAAADGERRRDIGDVGLKLKSTSGWDSEGNGINSVGFNALPSGYRDWDPDFHNLGIGAYFWTATSLGDKDSWVRSIYSNLDEVYRYYVPKIYGYSIRCVKN